MLDCHDRSFVVLCRDEQLGRERGWIDNERMVAAGNHGIGNASKQAFTPVLHGAGSTVHRLPGSHEAAAECRRNHLMAQAHAQHRHAAPKGLHCCDRAARLDRRAGARRDHNRLRREAFDGGHIDGMAGIDISRSA